jgi:hypothetical protein
MLGYKGFHHDLTCLGGFQYEVGQTYTMDPQDIELCLKGFHFCQISIDVLQYYNKSNDKYAIVKAEGRILDDQDKSVTNQLTVVELITKEKLMTLTTGLFVRKNGTKEWYQNGQLHRLDGPAIEGANGYKTWYQFGVLHRLDGPAIEFSNGDKKWYQKGQLHRWDGPAVEFANEDKCWYQKGKLHRLDGPAVEFANEDKCWYQNGQLQSRKWVC